MNIFLIDVDNTIAPFQPTAELYKRVLLKKNDLKYLTLGYFMIIMLKLFWWLPPIVEFQRKLIMSLLSRADSAQLEQESGKIAAMAVDSYETGFKKVLAAYKRPGDKTYLLTHCPDIISRKIASALNFDGEYSIKLEDYFANRNRPVNMDKLEALRKIRTNNINPKIYYFADDLIDIKCLLEADEGVLINASVFTKIISRVFFRKVKIWT